MPLLEEAAKQGHAAAQNELGLCYDIGQGFTQDDAQVMRYYQLAANQGHSNAKSTLRGLSGK